MLLKTAVTYVVTYVRYTGNHVKSRALCVASRQRRSKNMTSTFFHSMYNKIIIRLGFYDIQNNRGFGKG